MSQWLVPVGYGALGVLGVFLIWPVFGGDFPPGVDTPTFLHLAWVTRLALTGEISPPWVDPFWYGGRFPYLQAYPPLAYGLVGGVSAVTGVEWVGVYRGVLAVGYVGTGWATAWLAQEMGLARWTALLAGLVALLGYPVLAALGLWGWFTSCVALPLVLLGYGLLERGVWRGKGGWAALGGVCFGLGALAHHMTAFGIGLALLPWGVYALVRGVPGRRQVVRAGAAFMGATGVVALPWGIPFLLHALPVGFRREIPGVWAFPPVLYAWHAISPEYIGRYIYPSYLGGSLVLFGILGLGYAIGEGRRLPGVALVLLCLVWFSLGVGGNPLYRFYPFSGLDTARFSLFLMPFMAILAAAVVDAGARAMGRRLPTLAARGVAGVLAVALVALPAKDAWTFRQRIQPYRVDPQVRDALGWLATHTAPHDLIFSGGMWFWDTFLIPYLSRRPLVHGWHDEGAPSWRQVGALRGAVWSAHGSVEEVYATLKALGARYVVVGEGLFSPEASGAFRQGLDSHPQGFSLRARWERVRIYQVR
jgi:hypothetical protein